MNLPLIIANTASNSTRSLQSLSMLIRDYQQSYAGAWHTLIKVSRTLSDLRLHARLDIKSCAAHTPLLPEQIYVGFPFSHEVFSSVRAQPCVDCSAVTPATLGTDQVASAATTRGHPPVGHGK